MTTPIEVFGFVLAVVILAAIFSGVVAVFHVFWVLLRGGAKASISVLNKHPLGERVSFFLAKVIRGATITLLVAGVLLLWMAWEFFIVEWLSNLIMGL